MPHQFAPPRAAGFTFIEILLVIVLLVILSAMVAPSFFSLTEATPAQEARGLQKTLRMLAEEAQISGRPVLLQLYPDRVEAFTSDGQGAWQPLRNEVFDQRYTLRAPVRIREASLNAGAPLIPPKTNETSQEIPALARFLLMPDGDLTMGNIVLDDGEARNRREIRLEPGPAGISVRDPAERQ